MYVSQHKRYTTLSEISSWISFHLISHRFIHLNKSYSLQITILLHMKYALIISSTFNFFKRYNVWWVSRWSHIGRSVKEPLFPTRTSGNNIYPVMSGNPDEIWLALQLRITFHWILRCNESSIGGLHIFAQISVNVTTV